MSGIGVGRELSVGRLLLKSSLYHPFPSCLFALLECYVINQFETHDKSYLHNAKLLIRAIIAVPVLKSSAC